MASKKNVDTQPNYSPKYQPLSILCPADFPRIAKAFQKVQIMGGILATKLSQVFTGFYINNIHETWSVESGTRDGVDERILVLRLEYTFVARNKKLFSELEGVYASNSEVLEPAEIQL